MRPTSPAPCTRSGWSSRSPTSLPSCIAAARCSHRRRGSSCGCSRRRGRRWERPCRIASMSEEQVTVAEEEYLQILYWLHEAGLPMTAANVARAMQLSAPPVPERIGPPAHHAYITRAQDKSIAFTPSGQEHAETIVSRHRLIERFLTEVLGIPWAEGAGGAGGRAGAERP